MPLHIIQNDITKMTVDAIVNAANNTLLGGGGVDGCIHKAAGPELLEECKKLNGCATGEAKITNAGKLKAKYVIHAVGPIWYGGAMGEKALLESCYKKSLKLAKEYNCTSIAFPLISAGAYGYPKAEALNVAQQTISSFLKENDMDVYIVIFDKSFNLISQETFSGINQYINENLEPELDMIEGSFEIKSICANDFIFDLDESFSQMLFRLIKEKGISEVECYKNANIDRKLFSKIRSNDDYRPKKETVLAFAISLKLSLDDTNELLRSAGFAFSHASKFDIIIEYFIKNENYNIFEINACLFEFDQKLLGN